MFLQQFIFNKYTFIWQAVGGGGEGQLYNLEYLSRKYVCQAKVLTFKFWFCLAVMKKSVIKCALPPL